VSPVALTLEAMADASNQEPGLDWEALFSTDVAREALETERHGVGGLWTSLASAASETEDLAARSVFESLAKVASLFVRPHDWQAPYGPALAIEDRRSAIPSDLTEDEVAALRSLVAFIPHTLLRARVSDVLSILSTGQERITFAAQHLDALIESGITSESLMHERDMWDRGLLVARRYGKPMRARLAKLEQELRRVIRTSTHGVVAVRAADLLAAHGLASDRAAVIAERLEALADGATGEPERSRAYLRSATEWFARAGLPDRSHRAAQIGIQGLIDEAEAHARAGGAQDTMRGSHLFELALQRVRAMPRAARDELGLSHLPALIARRIRELGAASLGSMTAFTSDAIDLSSAARQARDQVKGRPAVQALLAFSALSEVASYSAEIAAAEELIREHPLQSLFSTVHYSRDGRVVFRSGGQGGEPIYGVDQAVWQQMIQMYSLRIRLLSQGMLWPAFVQLTNEHHLGIGDFATIVRDTGLVPVDRTFQFARALYYGYNGDFSTATQLLTPQLENLVRHHLANAGEATSTITAERIESEVGISALMERASASEVFGEDLAFELRALLCGPIGPNLRNEVAHGLLTDTEASSGSGLYLWWFALRLVFIPYWNALHDTDAAEAREPATPVEGDDVRGA
jgi:hypothetical protein